MQFAASVKYCASAEAGLAAWNGGRRAFISGVARRDEHPINGVKHGPRYNVAKWQVPSSFWGAIVAELAADRRMSALWHGRPSSADRPRRA